MYTIKQWKKDVVFYAAEGEEVEQEIYDKFMNFMLPLSLRGHDEYEAGFLCPEPYGSNENGLTYPAFGMKNNRYYFIGYINK